MRCGIKAGSALGVISTSNRLGRNLQTPTYRPLDRSLALPKSCSKHPNFDRSRPVRTMGQKPAWTEETVIPGNGTPYAPVPKADCLVRSASSRRKGVLLTLGGRDLSQNVKLCRACHLTFAGESWATICFSCWKLKRDGIDPYRNALDSIATAFIQQASAKDGRAWKKRKRNLPRQS